MHSLHPVCKEGVRLLEVACLEKLGRCPPLTETRCVSGQLRWEPAALSIVMMMSLDSKHGTFLLWQNTHNLSF